MDVQLYVYDLSQGLARQFSLGLTGVQIDAIYHTAIVLNNVEYFFGQGIHRKVPGTTHHGQPMKIVSLGKTDLPFDVIEEYIQSLEPIYTPESYDLFLHNCNNFTQDLSMFLTGQSIPSEISSLPETFLRTPIGQMLRGQIDQSMRTMTQAPDAIAGQDASRARPPISVSANPMTNGSNSAPGSSKPAVNGIHQKVAPLSIINSKVPEVAPGHVHNVTTPSNLDALLRSASHTCAVIFFTSVTCPPCKICYAPYEELASEAGPHVPLIKVDISASSDAQDIARRFSIRATPTFITFLRGQKQEEWAGADPMRLRGNVRLLLQMSKPKPHPHANLRLPTFSNVMEKPIMYTRTPPLDKLLAKLGPPFSTHHAVTALTTYITTREAEGVASAAIPDLKSLSTLISTSYSSIAETSRFALVDLMRVACVDPRISSYLATETSSSTIRTLFPDKDTDLGTQPFNIQSTTLQFACNLFSSPLLQEQVFLKQSSPLAELLESIAAQGLLAQDSRARSMAAALTCNLAAYVHNVRVNRQCVPYPVLPSDGDHEDDAAALGDDLNAALLDAVVREEGEKETLRALLRALGLSLYGASAGDIAWDLCRAMEVRESLTGKRKLESFKKEKELIAMMKEVDELLGGGF